MWSCDVSVGRAAQRGRSRSVGFNGTWLATKSFVLNLCLEQGSGAHTVEAIKEDVQGKVRGRGEKERGVTCLGDYTTWFKGAR